MFPSRLCVALALASVVTPAFGGDKPKVSPKSFQVPYRLTLPKHLLVRAKVNGKGPFNFILDTGAPAMFLSTSAAKKAGITADANGWSTFDKVEIEGGVVLTKVKARIENPFQLESMNGMGLAGAELHGILGYNVLARHRIEIDFTRDKLTWTPLDWEPQAPAGLGGRGGGAGGLEMVGTIMKTLGGLLGRKTTPDTAPRGLIGVELEDGAELPGVKAALADGPAGKAGVKTGDRISHVQGRSVLNVEDVQRLLRKLRAGEEVTLTVVRGKENIEFRFTAAEGL